MEQMNMDVGLLTEAKLMDGIYTRFSSGCHVVATDACSHSQGGVALFYRELDCLQVESVCKHGPNVISFELVTGRRHTPIVGAHIPPADLETIEHITRAMERFPGRDPLLLGDLNVDLGSFLDPREVETAAAVASFGLEDLLPHFRQHRGFCHGKTWRPERLGQVVSSQCNHILGSDRRVFQNTQLKDPRSFSSDHLAVCGRLLSAPLWSNRHCLFSRK
jgi:hypothetical protein